MDGTMLLAQPCDILKGTLCLHGQLRGQGRCRPPSPACAGCRLGASCNDCPSHTAHFPGQRTEAQSHVPLSRSRASGWRRLFAHLTAAQPQITTRRVSYATGDSPRGVVKGTSTPGVTAVGQCKQVTLWSRVTQALCSPLAFLFGVGWLSPSRTDMTLHMGHTRAC